ncbi:MAG: ATP-binding protein [Pseudomonadota bacterium]
MNALAQIHLPDNIRERVFDVLTATQAPQWIETDQALCVQRSLGAQLLAGAEPGVDLPEILPCLVGAEGVAPVSFPVVNLDSRQIVDVHVFAAEAGYEVLLIDASASHAVTQNVQQQAHEIQLLNRRLEKLTEALEQARAEAETASTAKSRFIAGMSHEFRSPLTAVMGFTELMQQGVAGPEQALSGIRESALYLLSLIDNLLEHGAAESGEVVINRETTDAGVLFSGIVRQMHPLAAAKHLELTLNAPAAAALDLVLDPVRCRQILINLLTNAVRHTETGGIELSWRVSGQRLQVSVTDSGSGITPAELERIFVPFERGAGAAGRPGAGLGLAISRQLAEAMDGTLTVSSTPGEGSCFTLELPLPARPPIARAKTVASTQARILVVDDDSNIRAVLSLALADAGHEVDCRASLAEVTSVISQQRLPDLALVDLDLYGSDGLEVVSALKSRAPELPVLAMSAATGEDVARRTRQAGCQGFIAKPFELVALASTIQQALTGLPRE